MQVELTVFESDFGLASADVDCLIIITYFKFARINYTIKYGKNPLLFKMPRLRIKNKYEIREYVGFLNIWNFLYHENLSESSEFKLDYYEVPYSKPNAVFYDRYLRHSILPALYFALWSDNQNFKQVTEKWHLKALQFPLNYFYTYNQAKKLAQYLYALAPCNSNYIDYNLIIEKARQGIDDLSIKLGNKNYFFGDKPSSVDAVIYGIIASMINTPTLVPYLQTYVKNKDNLVKFVKSVNKNFYPQQPMENKYVGKINIEDDFQEYTTSKSSLVLFTAFTTTAMICYGMSIGLLKMPYLDF